MYQNVHASTIAFAVNTLSCLGDVGKTRDGPREAQPAKESKTGPQGFSLRKWQGWEKRRPSPPPCFKEKALGTRLEKSAFA